LQPFRLQYVFAHRPSGWLVFNRTVALRDTSGKGYGAGG